ncbi:MAG: oligosaccharide flippase family protein [Patescibacteria group bacterium]
MYFFKKVDIAYAAKGGFWAAVRFSVGIATSLATLIAFGNLLPKENYGVYNYLLSLASALGFLTLTGIGPGIVRAVTRGSENVIRKALRLQLVYNLFAVVTIGFAAIYYGTKGNSVFAASLAILAISIPLEAAFHSYEHVLIGRKRFDLLALIASLSAFMAALTTIVILLFTDSVLILLSGFAVMSVGPSIIAFWYATRNLPRENPDEKIFAELKRSAFHITGAGLIGTLAQYIDKVLLFQIAGPATLAVYGFATAGPERLKGLLKNWVGIVLPRLAERNISEIKSVFYHRLILSFGVGTIFSFSYIVLAPILFGLFLPKYLDSILYSQVYALGLIMIPALVYVGSVFYSQNMLRAIYISSTGAQLLRIILFALFAWLWQIWGLVFAFLLTQVLSILYGVYVWEKESHRLINKKQNDKH